MTLTLKGFWGLFASAGTAWKRVKAARLGAALSFYTILAIPPLFVIVIFIASLALDPNTVRSKLFAEVGGLVGEQGAQAIESAMASQYDTTKGLWASMVAICTLVVSATGLFIELQDALNTVWGVKEKPAGIVGFIKNRLLSFAMVMGIGFLLLVSLIISTALSAFGKYLSGLTPGVQALWTVVNAFVSFGVVTVLFALIFKVLPDVKITWRDVWIGAVVTALLFTAGKFLMGLYLGRSSIVSAYGAAGSLILILLWVYYSAQILFFGAELTRANASRLGRQIKPARNAEWASDAESASNAPPKKEGSLSPNR
jgi:membrane protein